MTAISAGPTPRTSGRKPDAALAVGRVTRSLRAVICGKGWLQMAIVEPETPARGAVSTLYISETTAGAIYPNSQPGARFSCRYLAGEGCAIRSLDLFAETKAPTPKTRRHGKTQIDSWVSRPRTIRHSGRGARQLNDGSPIRTRNTQRPSPTLQRHSAWRLRPAWRPTVS